MPREVWFGFAFATILLMFQASVAFTPLAALLFIFTVSGMVQVRIDKGQPFVGEEATIGLLGLYTIGTLTVTLVAERYTRPIGSVWLDLCLLVLILLTVFGALGTFLKND